MSAASPHLTASQISPDVYDLLVIPPEARPFAEMRWDRNQLDRNPPTFQKPEIIGCFSIDPDQTWTDGHKNMKYLHHPGYQCHLDLNLNREKTKHKNALDEKGVVPILQWIQKHQDRFRQENSKFSLPFDFVVWRGYLTSFFNAPYENREPFIVVASRHKGTIYVRGKKSAEKVLEVLNMTPQQKILTGYGYKFEQFLMGDSPQRRPNPSEPLVEGEEFACVFRSRLGRHRLLYAAEVDGVDSRVPLPNDRLPQLDNLVELKTTFEIRNARQDTNFRKFKLMKWWAQSYLVGIPRIICGYRNEDGIVRGLEDFNTMTMHRLGKGFWQPNIPMVFALRMLDFIQSCLPHDDPNKQLAFIWTPGETVKCYDVSGQVEVLPQWYLEMTES